MLSRRPLSRDLARTGHDGQGQPNGCEGRVVRRIETNQPASPERHSGEGRIPGRGPPKVDGEPRYDQEQPDAGVAEPSDWNEPADRTR